MIFGGKRSCFIFIIVTISLWKSDRSVSKVKQSSKHLELLVRNKSIQDGLLTFLKQLALCSEILAYTDCKIFSYLLY